MINKSDLYWMDYALNLAKKGKGYTSPNPCVAAVLVDEYGQLIKADYHKKAGSPHAERLVLDGLDHSLIGNATLYVTLEPCNHHGQTPPCTDLIIKSGIKKVRIATIDPNPLVAGEGIKALERAGIDVIVGILAVEAKELNKQFFHWITTKKSYLNYKIACSNNYKTSTKYINNRWITNERSRQLVHQMRSEYDSILTTSSTVQQDNPRLNVRYDILGYQPQIILLDRSGSITDPSYHIWQSEKPIIIYTNNQKAIYPDNSQIYYLESLLDIFQHISHDLKKTSIMIEAGAILFQYLTGLNMVDEINIFQNTALSLDEKEDHIDQSWLSQYQLIKEEHLDLDIWRTYYSSQNNI